MKVLSSNEIRKADAYTIEHEPISSIDLMERASKAFVTKFKSLYPNKEWPVIIFCGVGNNGGDGLAIARLLHEADYHVKTFSIGALDKASNDFSENFKRLPASLKHTHLQTDFDFPLLSDHEIIIDGLFGSGLSRPITGLVGQLIHYINTAGAQIISIDIASGLFADQHSSGDSIITPRHTISFELPKLAFFLPENERYVGEWHLVSIGLNEEFISNAESTHYYLEETDVSSFIPKRTKFVHKGNAGRLLIVSGSKGKMGAASLATRAALRTGAGLLYVHTPKIGRDVIQVSVPEAMVFEDQHAECISYIEVPENITGIAIGPGIGTEKETATAVHELLQKYRDPMVIDADAINILGANPEWKTLIPNGSILTPHPKEFERLVGKWKDEFHRLELMRTFCEKYHVHMVLKGAHSAICHANGDIYFNSTGNAGMATGGSGDVLTGILGSLLAQGIPPADALRLGVYVHGLAGDLAELTFGQLSMSASDIVDFLPQAIRSLN